MHTSFERVSFPNTVVTVSPSNILTVSVLNFLLSITTMTVQLPVSAPLLITTPYMYLHDHDYTPPLFCSLHVVFNSLLNVSSAPIPHAQSYTPLQEHFICSFTDSSRPDPCSLPRTCHLLVLRFLPPRAMLPSVDMLSTSPPLPPTAFTATITPHTLLFVFALRLGTINTTRNAMTTQ